jgi:DNA ligase (NAD+)
MKYDIKNLSELEAYNLLTKLKMEINSYNKAYYNDSISIVSDAEYDQLMVLCREIEKVFPQFADKDSPTQTVGYKVIDSFGKVEHKVPMLSLANAFTEEDLRAFLTRVQKFLSIDYIPEICCELKIDGVSFSVRYEEGQLVRGSSRGDGIVGEDITHNLLTIKGLPHNIDNAPKVLEVRGEIYIDKADLSALNQEQEALGKQIFANPRNAASGSLRQLDANIAAQRPLKYFIYGIGDVSEFTPGTQYQMLEYFESLGFIVNPNKKVVSNQQEIMAFYNNAMKIRDNLPYEIDGVVYKVNDLNLQKRLGVVARDPRYAIAHKFPAVIGSTVLNDITVQVGRTGALTPVAELESISIGGVIVSRASLYNKRDIEKKDIRLGDTVFLQRAGDVIPQVIEVDLTKRKSDSIRFEFPKNCPSCGSELFEYEDEAVIRCENGLSCPAQVYERLVHFVSKSAMNIDGLGKQQVAFLLEHKLVSDPVSIFTFLTTEIEDFLKSQDGWGIRSVSNLKTAIENSKTTTLPKFIFALGIRHIGELNARLLAAQTVKSVVFLEMLKSIRDGDVDVIRELNDLDGIGDKTLEAIKEFCALSHNLELVENLIELLDIEDYKPKSINSPIAGKTIVFTGSLEKSSRDEAKNIAEKSGAKVASQVSKNVDFVVVGVDAGSKLRKAQELGVKILTEDRWLELISTGG